MNLTLLATEGFGLNFNLFETNILNWAVVVFGLYKFLPGFLGKMLQKRREGILLELKDAEDRLLNATKALEKAKKDLSSAEEKASQIKADSLKRSESIRMESEKKAIEEMARIKQMQSLMRALKHPEQFLNFEKKLLNWQLRKL